MPSRSRKLTLIEIASTVALVVLFTWLVIPVFSAAAAERFTDTCQSNLRDLGIASRTYCVDYDDRLYRIWVNVPPDTPESLCRDGKRRRLHLQALGPYLPEGSSVICPASEPIDCCHPMQRSYHPQTGLWRDENGKFREARLDVPGQPERMMLWGEGAKYLSIHPDALGAHVNHSVHNGGSNVCFVDGHVAWVEKDDLLDLHYGEGYETAF